MPAVPSSPRVKLRATSRRVPRARIAVESAEHEVDSEPNMRLSRAILVMLLLHVVAVGGVLAFSLIKEKNGDRRALDAGSNASGALEAEDSMVPATKLPVRPESSGGTAGSSVHVVQPGETLLRIANDYGVTVDALVAINGAQTAMSSLRPGQELKLPDKSPDPSSQLPEHALPVPTRKEPGLSAGANIGAATATMDKAGHLPADSGKIYTVGKGENPYGIAQKLKVSYDSLLKLNRIDDPKKLRPGQKLHVPAVSTAKSKQG